MTQEALKQMYQLLLTEPHAPTVCAQLERIAREALAEHAMRETQRLGQEIEPDDIASILACRDMLDAQPVPPQPEQEPVAWGVFEGNLHDMFFTEAEAVQMADLKGTHAEVKPLYTTPPQRTEPAQQKKVWTFWDLSGGDITDAIKAKLKEKNT